MSQMYQHPTHARLSPPIEIGRVLCERSVFDRQKAEETNNNHLMPSNTARAWIRSTVLWPLVNQP
jgi:hypothetical protein